MGTVETWGVVEWSSLASSVGVWTFVSLYFYTLLTTGKGRQQPSEDGGRTGSVFERLRNEPALIGGLITAAAGLLAAFGLDLSGEQVAAITALIGAMLAIAVRQSVTPVRKIKP